ncbi:hypothetical protein LTR66_007216 [Elasticomyces elasticus]|nr:hypothetical protein LTR66_007216 [Elasticomyces elasticus]
MPFLRFKRRHDSQQLCDPLLTTPGAPLVHSQYLSGIQIKKFAARKDEIHAELSTKSTDKMTTEENAQSFGEGTEYQPNAHTTTEQKQKEKISMDCVQGEKFEAAMEQAGGKPSMHRVSEPSGYSMTSLMATMPHVDKNLPNWAPEKPADYSQVGYSKSPCKSKRATQNRYVYEPAIACSSKCPVQQDGYVPDEEGTQVKLTRGGCPHRVRDSASPTSPTFTKDKTAGQKQSLTDEFIESAEDDCATQYDRTSSDTELTAVFYNTYGRKSWWRKLMSLGKREKQKLPDYVVRHQQHEEERKKTERKARRARRQASFASLRSFRSMLKHGSSGSESSRQSSSDGTGQVLGKPKEARDELARTEIIVSDLKKAGHGSSDDYPLTSSTPAPGAPQNAPISTKPNALTAEELEESKYVSVSKVANDSPPSPPPAPADHVRLLTSRQPVPAVPDEQRTPISLADRQERNDSGANLSDADMVAHPTDKIGFLPTRTVLPSDQNHGILYRGLDPDPMGRIAGMRRHDTDGTGCSACDESGERDLQTNKFVAANVPVPEIGVWDGPRDVLDV